MKITKTTIAFCHDSSLAQGELKVFKPYSGSGEEKTETRKETEYTNYTLSLEATPVILSDSNDSEIRDFLLDLRNLNQVCAGLEMHFAEESAVSELLPSVGSYTVLIKYPSELPQNCTNKLHKQLFIVHKDGIAFPKLSKFWPLKDWITSDLNLA